MGITKQASSRKILGGLLLAAFCLCAADSWARPPRARELCGVIQAIDPQTHTLTVQLLQRVQPLTVVWKHDTKFIRNWTFADSASLKEGTRGCVYYRTPFFGKPFVTKVVWTNGPRLLPSRNEATTAP